MRNGVCVCVSVCVRLHRVKLVLLPDSLQFAPLTFRKQQENLVTLKLHCVELVLKGACVCVWVRVSPCVCVSALLPSHLSLFPPFFSFRLNTPHRRWWMPPSTAALHAEWVNRLRGAPAVVHYGLSPSPPLLPPPPLLFRPRSHSEGKKKALARFIGSWEKEAPENHVRQWELVQTSHFFGCNKPKKS